MPLTFTIGGVDRSSLVRWNSFQPTDNLNNRSTAQFALLDPAGAVRLSIGQEVVVLDFDGLTRHFGGTIDDLTEETPWGTSALLFVAACVDYTQLGDRHLVARAYDTPGQTLEDIVLDIVAEDLAGEGVTTAAVETGPVVSAVVFSYESVTDAFNRLATLTGYSWYIDYNKDLHFFARESNPAPIAITATNAKARRLRVRSTRGDYRNRQYVRAGTDLTASRTESFKGDGTRKTFNLSFPAGAAPTVTVNAVSATVGIKGVETGKDWYWNQGAAEISQDDGASALGTGDTLAVTYRGLFPILVLAQDDLEIASRAALEGGTGIYEALDVDEGIDDDTLALDKAVALLRRDGRIPRTVEFETDEVGLRAGQLLPITVPANDLSGDWLIDAIDGQDLEGQRMRYQVRALDGAGVGGWQAFFRALLARRAPALSRENEMLLLLRTATAGVVCSDVAGSSSAAPESRVGFALVGYAEVGV